jgi:ribosome modulation factor
MKFINIARRRLDGLIDPQWVEGFDAFRSHGSRNSCPYSIDTEQFNSWMEGWRDAEGAGALEEQESSQ